jgi:hypothetical protein
MSKDHMRIACICVAGILAANLASSSKERGLLPQLHVGGVTGVITTPVLLAQELHQCSRATPAGDATPAPLSQIDLEEFESGVPAMWLHTHPRG